jgi:uncharacterized protein YdeI (YjbR/CyaY-like superfamily)
LLKEKENSLYAKNSKAWRNWLHKNHQLKECVWLIIYKKQSSTPSVYYAEAVEDALCYGWIDSLANKRDDKSYYQYFSKRKPKSNWSKVNKLKVAHLTAKGLMMPAGLAMVELAKKSGTWEKLNEVDEVIVPADLQKLFNKNKVAFANWNKFARSARRGILEWILNAKKNETREKRMQETVALAAQNIKANYPATQKAKTK